MAIFNDSIIIYAIITAVVGVLVFGYAPRLPSVFPPSFTRLVGIFAVVTALAPLWTATESWVLPATVGGCALVVMLMCHRIQTRPASTPVEASPANDEAVVLVGARKSPSIPAEGEQPQDISAQ